MRALPLPLPLLLLCALACSDVRSGSSEPEELSFEPIALEGDPVQATHFLFLPGGDELLLGLKDGHLLHYRLDGDAAERLGEVAISEVWSENDCGLQAIEADPDYAENGIVYAAGCIGRTANRIWRLTLDTSDYAAVEESIVTVLTVEEPEAPRPFHNAGSMSFDDDGMLWAPFGDKVVRANGQDRSTHTGAVLRLEPERAAGGEGHSAPGDNPFAMDPEASELVYAHGFRAPWRSFRDHLGRVWVSDVGTDKVEEINVITEPGQNFGWSTHQGPCDDACDDFVDPVLSWDHDDEHPYMLDDSKIRTTEGRAGWVGVMYEPNEADPYDGLLDDHLLFGEYCVGWMRAMAVDAALQVTADRHVGHLETVVGMRQGEDGFLYALTFGTCGSVIEDPPPSVLYRVRHAGASPATELRGRLAP